MSEPTTRAELDAAEKEAREAQQAVEEAEAEKVALEEKLEKAKAKVVQAEEDRMRKVPGVIPPELRGKRLTPAQARKYRGKPSPGSGDPISDAIRREVQKVIPATPQASPATPKTSEGRGIPTAASGLAQKGPAIPAAEPSPKKGG